MFSASSPLASTTRSGAGDGVSAAAMERHKQANVERPSAATCRRRRVLASTPSPGQPSTPAKPPQARSCSMLQAVSLPARTITSRSSAMPAAAQAGACGSHGGATRASQPPACDSLERAGSNRLISPTPLRPTSNSVSVPRGQPPPGNSASSSGWPLGIAASAREASVSPRQTSPLASTSAKATGNGKAFMTASSLPRVSGRRQRPRWQIRLRRGER